MGNGGLGEMGVGGARMSDFFYNESKSKIKHFWGGGERGVLEGD